MNNFIPNGNMGMGNVNLNIPTMNPYRDNVDRYMNLAQQQTQMQQRQNGNEVLTNMNFVVVENLQKAKEQIVPCGYTMWMRDSNEPYQYIKSVDQVGTPSFKILKVEDVTEKFNNEEKEVPTDTSKFVPIEEFNSLGQKVQQLQNTIDYFKQMLLEQEDEEVEVVKEVKRGRPKTLKVGDIDA